jgi:hypothetical protein
MTASPFGIGTLSPMGSPKLRLCRLAHGASTQSEDRVSSEALRGLPRRGDLGPLLGDNEPDDGVGQQEVDKGQDDEPAVHQRSHRLLVYRAPAVKAQHHDDLPEPPGLGVSGVLAICVWPVGGHAAHLPGYQLPVVVGVAPTAPTTRQETRPLLDCW